MGKYGVVVFLMLTGLLFTFEANVSALDLLPKNEVIFSEVFPGNPTPNAGQEFIEIYNNSDRTINLQGWRLQYTSAAKIDWNSPSRNIVLSGLIEPKKYYLIATTGYLPDIANLSYSSSLSQSGGHLRLLNKDSELEDQIGWGNAAMPLGIAIEAPNAGSSLARLTNFTGFNLSLDNITDFSSSLSPTPATDNIITLPVVIEEDFEPVGYPTLTPSTPPPSSIKYDEIQISELLPNPSSPGTDSVDEFVELYNPNPHNVDLTGYIIKTGISGTYKYTIKDQIIEAGSYLVFYSKDTHLVLSNTSGKAQIIGPDGILIDETEIYSKAGDGQTWIYSEGKWLWSSSATAGADNVYTPVSVVKAASTTKKAFPKTVKAKSTKKSATKAKKKKAEKAAVPLAAVTSKPPTNTIHPFVLASVGASALLYALYEYRNDLASTLYRLRRYRDARGGFRSAFTPTAASRVNFRFGRWKDHLYSWFSARTR